MFLLILPLVTESFRPAAENIPDFLLSDSEEPFDLDSVVPIVFSGATLSLLTTISKNIVASISSAKDIPIIQVSPTNE